MVCRRIIIANFIHLKEKINILIIFILITIFHFFFSFWNFPSRSRVDRYTFATMCNQT